MPRLGTPPRSSTPAARSACASCARSSTWWRATGTSGPERAAGGLGVLGGTFNPPHAGHLSAARAAHRSLGLDRILLVPVHTPPHKAAEEEPGPAHRMAMARLLAAEEPWLDACDIEIRRGGSSYTVDTLRALHTRAPDADLVLIVGSDMARTLPAWREPGEILALARVAVAERSGTARRQIAAALASLAPSERVCFLDMEPVEVSSSQVRRRVASGAPPGELVPAAIGEYIARRHLYRDGAGVTG